MLLADGADLVDGRLRDLPLEVENVADGLLEVFPYVLVDLVLQQRAVDFLRQWEEERALLEIFGVVFIDLSDAGLQAQLQFGDVRNVVGRGASQEFVLYQGEEIVEEGDFLLDLYEFGQCPLVYQVLVLPELFVDRLRIAQPIEQRRELRDFSFLLDLLGRLQIAVIILGLFGGGKLVLAFGDSWVFGLLFFGEKSFFVLFFLSPLSFELLLLFCRLLGFLVLKYFLLLLLSSLALMRWDEGNEQLG